MFSSEETYTLLEGMWLYSPWVSVQKLKELAATLEIEAHDAGYKIVWQIGFTQNPIVAGPPTCNIFLPVCEFNKREGSVASTATVAGIVSTKGPWEWVAEVFTALGIPWQSAWQNEPVVEVYSFHKQRKRKEIMTLVKA